MNKIIKLTLPALILVVSLLSACSDGSADTAPQDNAGQVQPLRQTPDEELDQDDSEPEYNIQVAGYTTGKPRPTPTPKPRPTPSPEPIPRPSLKQI